MTAPAPQPRFDIWAEIPAAKAAQNGWALVASGVTFEQAKVYKATFLYKVTFMKHQPKEGIDY